MYDSLEEVQQKLTGCVLVYKDDLIQVIQATYADSNQLGIICNKCDDPYNNTLTIKISDPELDFRGLGARLGYLNFSSYQGLPYKEAIYLMRIPRRSSTLTQGLSKQNVYLSNFKGDGTPERPPINQVQFDKHVFVTCVKELTRTINNVYPGIEQIREEFLSDKQLISRAFSKTLAIRHDEVGPYSLEYKNTRIGYSVDLKSFVLSDRYKLYRLDLIREGLKIA